LHGPQARDDHSGIFADTTARQRVGPARACLDSRGHPVRR
jgi:hypothetical protein